MKQQIAQIGCKPWTLNGLSDRLIVTHYESNYGSAVRDLNMIRERLAEVDFAERDLTPDWVVLTRQQLRERRLSGAGRSDERNVLARLERQRDAAHNRT